MDQKGRGTLKAELRSGVSAQNHCASLLPSYPTAQAQRWPKQGLPPQRCSLHGIGPSSHWRAPALG